MDEQQRIRVLEGALALLERKVDFLMNKLGVAYVDAQPPGHAEVIALLQAGEMIPAIKRYRELTGASLAEAKNAVEALDAELKATRARPPYR